MTASFALLMAAEPKADYETAEKVFPILDYSYWPSQIFWFVVTFILLYFILSRVFLPGVGQVLEERSSRIADDIDSASRMQREAEEANAAYETSLKDARAKAHNVAEATRASVDEEISREMAAADAEADKAAAIAETRIREIRAESMKNIDAVARETADAITAKLAGKPARRTRAAKA